MPLRLRRRRARKRVLELAWKKAARSYLPYWKREFLWLRPRNSFAGEILQRYVDNVGAGAPVNPEAPSAFAKGAGEVMCC